MRKVLLWHRAKWLKARKLIKIKIKKNNLRIMKKREVIRELDLIKKQYQEKLKK